MLCSIFPSLWHRNWLTCSDSNPWGSRIEIRNQAVLGSVGHLAAMPCPFSIREGKRRDFSRAHRKHEIVLATWDLRPFWFCCALTGTPSTMCTHVSSPETLFYREKSLVTDYWGLGKWWGVWLSLNLTLYWFPYFYALIFFFIVLRVRGHDYPLNASLTVEDISCKTSL